MVSPDGVAREPAIVERRARFRVLANSAAHVDLPDFVVEKDDTEPGDSWDHEVGEGEHPRTEHLADPRYVDDHHDQPSLEEQAKVCLMVNHELLAER